MTFTYHTDGCEITEKDKKLIEAKLSKLNHLGIRIDDESTKIHLKIYRGLRHSKPNYGMHIHFMIPNDNLDAKASGPTISDTVDKLESKLRKQINRKKS